MKKIDRKKLAALAYSDRGVLAVGAVIAISALALHFLNSILPKGIQIPYCLCHDFLRLYCPLCGCTRAGLALLHLDFAESLKANPLVLLFVLGLVLYNLVSLVRIGRGGELLRVKNAWVLTGISLFAFALVRNLLMIFFKFDTLGELVSFWRFV